MKQHRDIYALSPARKTLIDFRGKRASWDLGRLRNLPVWTEFATYAHFPAGYSYTHFNPNNFAFEIPLQGELQLIHEDRQVTLGYGDIYFLPPGEYNSLTILKDKYCTKWSIGMCGGLMNSMVNHLLGNYRYFRVKRVGALIEILKELQELLSAKSPDSPPGIAALSVRFLMELAEEVPEKIPSQLAEAMRILEFNIKNPIRIRQVAEELNLTEFQLRTLFLKHLGTLPKAWLVKKRMELAAELLEQKNPTKFVAQQTGYATSRLFYREFHKHYGMAPSHWRDTVKDGQKERQAE